MAQNDRINSTALYQSADFLKKMWELGIKYSQSTQTQPVSYVSFSATDGFRWYITSERRTYLRPKKRKIKSTLI